ncbi:MAG: nucleoside hydrolase [Bacteroidales bacterium]|nr:nucleoside hydrolase [Bacteroidales bacterium]MBQ4201446.1 nucleoside hydrolase [Bacteroidales bacterium]
MRKVLLAVALLALSLSVNGQNKLSDKELYNVIWAMGQMYPEGFTIDINTLKQPTEGIMVSYAATQNSFDKKSIAAVVKHARAHNGLVGGWYNPENGKYYFDSTRCFPEDSLAAAVAFARENGQHTVYDVAKGINVKSNYEQRDCRIIFDCDMGSSTDDLFALMLLYRYMDMKRCNLLGVIVDRMGAANADAVDIMNNFYGYPDIPVGLERAGIKDPMVFIPYHNVAYARTEDSDPMFKQTYKSKDEYPEGYKLYRKLLSEQPDKSVTIASVGFVTSLSRLLQSGPDEYSPLSGVELVRAKVKDLYTMGGVFGKAVEPDYNFTQAIDFSLKFFELWPKEIDVVFSPGEVGDPLNYKPELVISDMNWTDIHPIKWVYQNVQCDTGQKMWDPLAVINAVEGDELYTLSERGWVTLTPKGETLFTPDPAGNARYQLPGDEEWCDTVLKYLRLMAIQH